MRFWQRVVVGLSFFAGCASPSLVHAQSTFGGLILPAEEVVELDTITVKQYPAPAEYAAWMQEIITCGAPARQSDPLRVHILPQVVLRPDDVAWLAVPGAAFRQHHSIPLIGLTVPAHHAILLVERYIHHKQLVQHETLHMALYLAGLPYGHGTRADETFRRCGVMGQ